MEAPNRPARASLAPVTEFLARAGADHYQFLELPREADGATIVTRCE